MEANHTQRIADDAMTKLLIAGSPFDIGIPAWTLREITTRSTYAIEPSALLGLDPENGSKDIVSEYERKKGYEFSWGTLSEDICEEGDLLVSTFEVFPKLVLKQFPQPAMVEDLFIWMYENHPLRHESFGADEAHGDWFVMSFTAYEAKNISRLRTWLGTVFVTKIMQDLVSEAMLIVTRELFLAANERLDEDLFNEHKRFQLCGDPADLTFNKSPS
jgi:hypothetical protein